MQLDLNIEDNENNVSIFYDTDFMILNNLCLPERLVFARASEYEYKYLLTKNDLWNINYSGRKFSICFDKLDKNEKKLCKYLLSYYVQINTPSQLDYIFYAFLHFINYFKSNNLKINFKDSKKILIKCANHSYYYEIKFLIKILFVEGFYGFDFNEEFQLELIERPKQSNALYYENKLDAIDSPIINMINQGFTNVILNYKKHLKIDNEDLKQTVILGLHYATGLRPIQVSKLSVKDFKQDTHSSDSSYDKFSLLIPYAKQLRIVHEKIAVKLPEEIAELLKIYIKQFSLKSDDKMFELGDNAATYCLKSINNQLFKFSPKTYQLAVTNKELIPHKITFNDFRHHVGHSLAMSGASPEEIAYILGHSSLVAARHYIYSSPELAEIRARALGTNQLYQQMISMLLTGRLVYKNEWTGKKVLGNLSNKLHLNIGGCAYSDKCFLQPVRNCYGCMYFHPFIDGNHLEVRDCIQKEINDLVRISDELGVSRNPVIQVHEATKFEIDSVINRCTYLKDEM